MMISAHCGVCGRHVQEHGFECMFLVAPAGAPPVKWPESTLTPAEEQRVRAQVRAACDAAGWERKAGDD